MAADAKLYDQFEPEERLTLLLEAMARDDEREAQRLLASCVRQQYTMRDLAFQDRLERAFETMTIMLIDLRALWCKLELLHWVTSLARMMATHHQITATFAFMEGERFGKGQSQMDFFRKQRKEPELDDEPGDDPVADDAAADDDEPVLAAPEPLRASKYRKGELGRRMMAVEDRMQGTTDFVFVHLIQSAFVQAQLLADTWEAFSRFSHTRVGVSAETLLEAWGWPAEMDFAGMVKRYPGVKPNDEKVNEYVDLICRTWDQRFGKDY